MKFYRKLNQPRRLLSTTYKQNDNRKRFMLGLSLVNLLIAILSIISLLVSKSQKAQVVYQTLPTKTPILIIASSPIAIVPPMLTPEPTNTPEIEPTNTPEIEPTNKPEIEPTNTPEIEPTNTPERKQQAIARLKETYPTPILNKKPELQPETQETNDSLHERLQHAQYLSYAETPQNEADTWLVIKTMLIDLNLWYPIQNGLSIILIIVCVFIIMGWIKV